MASGKQYGLTLLEVLVALAIMAIISLLASQTFHTASVGAEATKESMDRLAAIDRTFVLIENDIRYAIPKVYKARFGENIPPVFISMSEGDYWMTIMRGSYPNPLNLPRTEEVRVGYRYVDEELWRDTWYNPTLREQDDARQQKLLEGVVSLSVSVLSSQATSLAAGPWLDNWNNPQLLPMAVRVTVELEDMGDIERIFAFLPGIPK